jgi:hypothetical protein
VAAQIVKFLLSKRFLPSVCDSMDWNAVHFAAVVFVRGSDEAAARKTRFSCSHKIERGELDSSLLALQQSF